MIFELEVEVEIEGVKGHLVLLRGNLNALEGRERDYGERIILQFCRAYVSLLLID